MRWLFVVLLLANLALAGYAWYASHQSSAEAPLLNQQVNADKIRIIPPKPMVLPPRPKITCLEWGTFGAGELKPAQAALAALGLGERLTSHDVQVVAGYWVYVPPLEEHECLILPADLRRIRRRRRYGCRSSPLIYI